MIATAKNLELQPWIVQTGPNINPVPADSFTATLIPGGILKVVNTSSKAWGGALVTCKPPEMDQVNSYANPYFGLDLEIYVPPADLANLGRLELDVKRCVVPAQAGVMIPNIGNGSTQLNFSTGQWQIDKSPPGWTDTGFEPILPPAWTPISFRHVMNASGYSVMSTKWGDTSFSVPASMQNLPLQESNWAQVMAVQIQTEVVAPGTVTIYLRNINLSVSDGPF